MFRETMTLSLVLSVCSLATITMAAVPGLVEDFNDDSHGFLSFVQPTRIPTGGVGGDGDGYLEILSTFDRQLGAHTEREDLTGNLAADGVTGYSFWLSELGTDDGIEVHVAVGIGFQNVWMTIEGFTPPVSGWEEFSVDTTDESQWVQIIDFAGGSFADAVAASDRLLFRHDRPPLEQSPEFITGDFGLDRITVLPACEVPAFLPGELGVSFGNCAYDGYVDPAAESTDGINADLGIDTFTVEFTTALENNDGSPLDASAFSVTDTAATPPDIDNISSPDGHTVTIELTDHITLQHRTTISVSARAQCNESLTINDSIEIGFLPCDVDQNGCVTPFDLLEFRQYVNGQQPPIGDVTDYIDIDRNGASTPFDLLAFRQLVNGNGNATQVWSGQCLP